MEPKLKWANRITISALVLILALTAVILLFGEALSEPNVKGLSIAIIILTFPLMASSYVIYKNAFQNQTDAKGRQPLFIPKVYGVGLSINPHHPLGKILWGVIVALMLFVLWRILIN
ncbi:MAG: hypothetical protein ACK5MW_02870 [Enterococcus sp.]